MGGYMKTTELGNTVNVVLKRGFAIPVTIDSTGVSADSDGLKIVKAGSPIGHATLTLKDSRTAKGSVLNTTRAQGVAINDVDVTNGDEEVAVMIDGVASLTKVESRTGLTISADAKTAMSGITFVTE